MRRIIHDAVRYGAVAVLLAALQPAVLFAEQSVTFDTHPVVSATTGSVYIYNAEARSSDGSAVRYSLQYGPSGMVVDETTGEISWLPATAGAYGVGIRAELVNDPAQSAAQEWQIQAAPASENSISILPLSFSEVCVGATVSVDYSATGNFVPGNAFILQISDAEGSFGNFLNIGSMTSTTSGTITAALPGSIPPGNHYRVRVIASNPVTVGSDNGSDIAVVPAPVANFGIIDTTKHSPAEHYRRTIAMTDSPVRFVDSSTNAASYQWDFGDGATPATSDRRDPGPVMYSTPGRRTISLRVISAAGCTSSVVTRPLDVFFRNPRIPSNAGIIGTDSSQNRFPSAQPIWVCPGGIYRPGEGADTIYVEAGGSVLIRNVGVGAHVIYLKSGASVDFDGQPGAYTVFHEAGASLVGVGDYSIETEIPLPQITFDYTDAPIGGCPSLAPHQKRIPDDVLMVHGSQTSGESQKEFWIRNGGVLEASGHNNVYIADAGARVVATGNSATVYLKNGSSFEARGSGGHRIFYEPDAVIVDAGAESGLFPSSELTYLYQGKVTGVRNVELLMESGDLEVSPNPAGEVVTVRHERAGIIIRRIELHDAVGRLVREEGVILHRGESGSISLAGLAPGVYYVRASSEGVVLVRKVVVR